MCDGGLHLQGECGPRAREPLIGEQDEGVLLSRSESREAQPSCLGDGFSVVSPPPAPTWGVLVSTREIQYHEGEAFGFEDAFATAQSRQGLLRPHPEHAFEHDPRRLGRGRIKSICAIHPGDMGPAAGGLSEQGEDEGGTSRANRAGNFTQTAHRKPAADQFVDVAQTCGMFGIGVLRAAIRAAIQVRKTRAGRVLPESIGSVYARAQFPIELAEQGPESRGLGDRMLGRGGGHFRGHRYTFVFCSSPVNKKLALEGELRRASWRPLSTQLRFPAQHRNGSKCLRQ